MTILLVDDDPEIRLIAGYLLRQAGHEVIEAANGAAAVQGGAGTQPDVVLMDLFLGEEDGVVVAEAVRTRCARPPALIFLTGAVREDQLAYLEGAQPSGIIRKPFDPETFAESVRAALEGGR
jgi:CheY-like chemotaxis protein